MRNKNMADAHFSKFTECVKDLQSQVEFPTHSMGEEYTTSIRAAINAIKTTHRFYMPKNSRILAGKELTSEIIELVRLPFDGIVLLGRQKVFLDANHTQSYECDRITIAYDMRQTTNKNSFATLSVVHERRASNLSDERWVVHHTAGLCTLGEFNGEGYTIGVYSISDQGRQMHKANPSALDDDVADVINLCVMLSLHNVKTSLVEPPAALNKKRLRSGLLPLFSYHVLEVDGELWDKPEPTTDGSGVRSHMRRGHIRRLTPERKVWVRATMVHGSRPGFVDKDYAVTVTGSVSNRSDN